MNQRNAIENFFAAVFTILLWPFIPFALFINWMDNRDFKKELEKLK